MMKKSKVLASFYFDVYSLMPLLCNHLVKSVVLKHVQVSEGSFNIQFVVLVRRDEKLTANTANDWIHQRTGHHT